MNQRKMSSPFVKIVDGKLNFFPLTIKETDIRILCILGKARMGKSTFLNTFVTQLEGVQPFGTQNNDEHCTRGIDYYFCEKEKILFLDCQGLALEDSSHDPDLLLFAYLVSDVIVFNERMMLQNEALKLLEPICTFMPYLEMNEKKPKLYFRISDGDMVTDIQKNLTKVIHTQYKDQYQTIRDSIQNLFHPDIGIVKTDSFDKKTKMKLQAGDYSALLEEDLGFTEAIQTLLLCLPQGKPSEKWNQDVVSYIDQINNNEKISIDKLDIVGQTGKIEILEWMNALVIYNEPLVDGTQKGYEEWVEPMKREKKEILSKFSKLFKAIPNSIKKSHQEKLVSLLNTPIQNVEKMCQEKAEEFLANWIKEAQSNQDFPIIRNDYECILYRQDVFYNQYFSVFNSLLKACEKVYLPVKLKYAKWVQDQLYIFHHSLGQLKNKEKEYIEKMKKNNTDILLNYRQNLLKIIDETDRIILRMKPSDVLEESYERIIRENKMKLVGMVQVHSLKVVIKEEKLTCIIEEVVSNVRQDYDLVVKETNAFEKELKEIGFHPDLLLAVTNRKSLLLENEIIHESLIPFLGDIDLVKIRDTCYLTKDTYDKTYKKIYDKTINTLFTKGYISESPFVDKTEKNITTISIVNVPHIQYLFEHRFYKVLAKNGVNGFVMPRKNEYAELRHRIAFIVAAESLSYFTLKQKLQEAICKLDSAKEVYEKEKMKFVESGYEKNAHAEFTKARAEYTKASAEWDKIKYKSFGWNTSTTDAQGWLKTEAEWKKRKEEWTKTWAEYDKTQQRLDSAKSVVELRTRELEHAEERLKSWAERHKTR